MRFKCIYLLGRIHLYSLISVNRRHRSGCWGSFLSRPFPYISPGAWCLCLILAKAMVSSLVPHFSLGLPRPGPLISTGDLKSSWGPQVSSGTLPLFLISSCTSIIFIENQLHSLFQEAPLDAPCFSKATVSFTGRMLEDLFTPVPKLWIGLEMAVPGRRITGGEHRLLGSPVYISKEMAQWKQDSTRRWGRAAQQVQM